MDCQKPSKHNEELLPAEFSFWSMVTEEWYQLRGLHGEQPQLGVAV
jgi:hypothetical protein